MLLPSQHRLRQERGREKEEGGRQGTFSLSLSSHRLVDGDTYNKRVVGGFPDGGKVVLFVCLLHI